MTGTRPDAVALIDGEHYAPVVRAALEHLGVDYRFVAALFLGGREKLRAAPGEDPVDALQREYGLPVFTAQRLTRADGRDAAKTSTLLSEALRELLARTGAGVVVDLSDEPVLDYRERFLLMSAAAFCGVRYVGADFELRPQRLATIGRPSLAVIGTGKRVGKTAVSGRLAYELAAAGERVVIVAMGRGGPPEPEIVDGGAGIGADELLAVSRRGRHAASDHYEDAVLAGVTTIGCRRCGGGLAGAPFDSTMPQALEVLAGVPASLVILEGSGSVIPPVRADATVCVAAASQPAEYVTGYLGTYRLLISDLIVLTLCEPPFASSADVGRLLRVVRGARRGLDVIPTVFRPRPASDVRGRRVALFTTAAPQGLATLTDYLQEVYGAEVVAACADLASRPALADAVLRAQREADVFLTEIKAAAIDVVAEAAAAGGKQLVFCDNEPSAIDGSDLMRALRDQAALAHRRFSAAHSSTAR